MCLISVSRNWNGVALCSPFYLKMKERACVRVRVRGNHGKLSICILCVAAKKRVGYSFDQERPPRKYSQSKKSNEMTDEYELENKREGEGKERRGEEGDREKTTAIVLRRRGTKTFPLWK